MKRFILASALCLFLSCAWFEQPKPDWSQQVGGLLDNIFGNLQQLIEANK